MQTPDAIWTRALRDLLQSNLALELVAVVGEGEPAVMAYNARLLEASEDASRLVLQRVFARRGEPSYFQAGRLFEVLLMTEGSRYAGPHTLAELGPFELNHGQRLMAMTFLRTGPVVSAQRRGSFRVDTSGSDVGVKVRVGSRGGAAAIAIHRPRVLNLSAHGLALQVRADQFVNAEPLNAAVKVEVQLPKSGEPMLLEGRVARYEPLKSGCAVMGIELRFPTHAAGRQLQDTLLKVTVEMQREQLRRVSGA